MERTASGRRTANPRSATSLRGFVAASAGAGLMSGATSHAQDAAHAAADNRIPQGHAA